MNVRAQLPATIALVLLLPLLWLAGVALTPAGEVGGALALSVAECVCCCASLSFNKRL